MAKKKKEPPIEGVGRKPEELLVQKSRPLFALWRSDLTLQEFKILDTYLARIDSHHPEKRGVVFEKGELEQLLGVSKINLPQLRERLKHLMGNVVEVGDPKQPKSMHLITLFDEAVAIQDEVTGLWEVRLECTQKAMKYCFNIEKLGYLRYKLRGIVSLQSRYSYILFLYIESHRKFKSWTVPLDELKATLKCDKEETYKEFKFFNQKILQRCSKEIFEKTDQQFTYAPIKKGRKVTAIQFTVETLSDGLGEADRDQLDIEDYLDSIGAGGEDLTPSNPYDELMDLLSSMCNGEFVREEIVVLYEAMMALPVHFQDNLAYADFLRAKYNEMLAADARKRGKKIVHRFKYLLALIRKAGD